MNRTDVDWKGYWVATPTPFAKDGALDEAAWRGVLRLYLGQGVHGVLINGTTGEWFAQSDAERRRVAEIAVEEVNGRIPVVIGCTTFTPEHTCELALHAKSIGADGVLSTPPPYAAPTPREILAFYQTISDRVSLPLMVYNWQRGTAVEILPDLAAELARIDRVVAIKESTADRGRLVDTLQMVTKQVRVFAGFVSRFGLGLMREVGGDGNIDGGGLGAPYGVRFFEAYWRGDADEARVVADQYQALMRQLIRPDWSGVFGSPQAQIKAAMNLLGQPGGFPRPPLLPIDDAQALGRLAEILDSSGLHPRAAVTAGRA